MINLELSSLHKSIGGKMVDYAGFNMAVQYEGVISEHLAVRNHVGVFDVSHMGEIFISGNEAALFLQFITSNDINKLYPGKVQYSCLPNKKGGIVDDILVYMFEENSFMLVVNASNIKKNVDWLNDNNSYDCKIENKSNDFSLLALQGPESLNLLQKLTKVNLSDLEYYTFTHGEVSEINDIIISRTGYTGELGFELYVKNKYVLKLWQDLFLIDKNLKPIGLAARNTLRLEKGFCLYGNDINDSTSPLEAGLGWITNLSKNFINSDYFVNQKNNGLKRKLVGFEIIGKGIARQHYKVFNKDNIDIGAVTSGSMSPSLNKAIGLAYINIDECNIGNNVLIQVRNKFLDATIVKIPFL
jgi:aminomethyltransferase